MFTNMYGKIAGALNKQKAVKPVSAPAPAPATPSAAQSPWANITPDNVPSYDNLSNILKQAGYTGPATEDYQEWQVSGGDAGDMQLVGKTRVAPGVNDWLTQNNYSIGQQRNGNDYISAVLDSQGNPLSQTGYHDRGVGPIKYIVPALLGGIAGGAALTGLGALGAGGTVAPAVGNGAFLGEAAWAPTAAAGVPATTIIEPAVMGGSGLAAAAASGAGSLGSFLKSNPTLAASALGGAATLLNGSGGNPPAIPSSGTSGGTSQAQLIQALMDKLYGPNGSMSGSFDYSSVPALKTSAGDPNQFNQQASDAAYANATRYLDTQVQQQQQALEARLAEQGFVPGTPGYKQAMQNFMDANARAYASARDSATLQGFTQGNTAFGQSLSNANLNNNASRERLAQLLAERNQPLNELNALKTGEQLAYDNQLGQYNANVESKNATNQALAQLALALGIYLG